MVWLFGPVVRVYGAAATRLHRIDVEDTLTAVLEFSSGALGTIEAATSIYPGYQRRLEMTGSEGTLTLEHDRLIGADLRSGNLDGRSGQPLRRIRAPAPPPRSCPTRAHTPGSSKISWRRSRRTGGPPARSRRPSECRGRRGDLCLGTIAPGCGAEDRVDATRGQVLSEGRRPSNSPTRSLATARSPTPVSHVAVCERRSIAIYRDWLSFHR